MEERTKYKVGDKVKVRRDLKIGACYSMKNGGKDEVFVSGMKQFKGKIVTIAFIIGGKYHIKEDNRFSWTDEMFKSVKTKNECLVIYRKDNKVIALDKSTGKKAEATCSIEDAFDFEVGAKLAFERLFLPECKFKVGDKVIARNCTPYSITTKGWTGKVIELLDPEKNFGDDIKVLDTDGSKYPVESKYFDLYKESEIKVGDKVKVIDDGECYSTYLEWVANHVSDIRCAAKYLYRAHVENGAVGTVIAIADHDCCSDRELVYIETHNGCYLIGIKGVEKC